MSLYRACTDSGDSSFFKRAASELRIQGRILTLFPRVFRIELCYLINWLYEDGVMNFTASSANESAFEAPASTWPLGMIGEEDYSDLTLEAEWGDADSIISCTQPFSSESAGWV